LAKAVRDADIALQKRSSKKKKKAAADHASVVNAPKSLDVFIASGFPSWQETVISVLKENYNASSKTFDDKALVAAMGKKGVLENKKAMPFANEIKKRVDLIGSAAFDRVLQFNEADLVSEAASHLKSSLGFARVNVIRTDAVGDGFTDAQAKVAQSAVPGEPGILITNHWLAREVNG
ncbi:cytosolic leucyl tRNA synthetase, partial [Coemansia sp. RSA 1939]